MTVEISQTPVSVLHFCGLHGSDWSHGLKSLIQTASPLSFEQESAVHGLLSSQLKYLVIENNYSIVVVSQTPVSVLHVCG